MTRSGLLRSMLYVPANSWRMLSNGLLGREDAAIFDLEDAVPHGEKETARIFARDAIPAYKEAGIDVYVRVNSISTGLTQEDVGIVMSEGLDGIVLSKTETTEDISRLAEFLKTAEEQRGVEAERVSIVALVETPRGVENVFAIAASNPRLAGIAFGAGDFLREMGVGFAVTRLHAEEYYPIILYPRVRLAQAAKANNLEAIDTPFFGLLIDVEGLRKETEQVKLLGFTGKQLTHPRHVDAANEVFSPSPEEIDYAKSIAAAYEEAEARGAGSTSFRGRMIDYAMWRMAKDMLSKAEAIAAKAESRQ